VPPPAAPRTAAAAAAARPAVPVVVAPPVADPAVAPRARVSPGGPTGLVGPRRRSRRRSPPPFVGPPAPSAAKPAVPAVAGKPAVAPGAAVPDALTKKGCWPIRRAWTCEELDKYAAFIERIYEKKRAGTSKQRQAKLDDILGDPDMNLFLSAWTGETKEQISSRGCRTSSP
jgi:hypothetical protein